MKNCVGTRFHLSGDSRRNMTRDESADAAAHRTHAAAAEVKKKKKGRRRRKRRKKKNERLRTRDDERATEPNRHARIIIPQKDPASCKFLNHKAAL